MNDEQIIVIFKPVDELWDKVQRSEGKSAWHGYGWREDETGLIVSPFVENPQDLTRIEDAIKAVLPKEIKVKGLVMPRFRARTQGKRSERLKPEDISEPEDVSEDVSKELSPLEPGKVVFASGCPDACPGTIGAFLTGGNPSSTWLLSNCHILVQCDSQKGVKGENGFFIGSDVRPVPLTDQGNVVDAAVVKVQDTLRIRPELKGMERITDPGAGAFPDLGEETPVQKLGHATGMTSGELILRGRRIKVGDCKCVEREFVDQLVIISAQNGEPFAAGGDSGSLVVAGGQPIGLLFAMTFKEPSETNEEPLTEFFLANRWDLVIQELSNVVGPLKLVSKRSWQAVG